MENNPLKQKIEALIAELGDDITTARPAAEREVIEAIRTLLDTTREERTASAREMWEQYLPYAADRCFQLSKLEEGWEDDLEFFASENAQFWVDNAGARLDRGDVDGSKRALAQIIDAARMIRRDRITQVDILLQALDYAVEISDRKRAIQLYEEAEKLHRKHLMGGSAFTGSAWLPKIKRMGQRLRQFREKLGRYYQYAETITVSLEADSETDLERVINHLQQNLPGKVTVTRRVKEVEGQGQAVTGRFRARLKISLE